MCVCARFIRSKLFILPWPFLPSTPYLHVPTKTHLWNVNHTPTHTPQIDFLELEHSISYCGAWKDVRSHLPHNFNKSFSEWRRWAKCMGCLWCDFQSPYPCLSLHYQVGFMVIYLYPFSKSISSENSILLLKKYQTNTIN